MGTATGFVVKTGLKFENITLFSRDPEAPDIVARSADLYTLNHNGLLQAAINPTIEQLAEGLQSFNSSFYEEDNEAIENCSGVLSIL